MKEFIIIKGAKENNLKNIDLSIPRNKLIVFTGLSGSGKTSLAFDTIFAEGQRRFIESLSSYARQFLGQMHKPDVQSIEGLSPAISIDQKTTGRNPRSTVGTVTEIYDYLRLFYARAGTVFCPECDKEIASQTIDQIVDKVLSLEEGSKILINAPVVRGRKGEYSKLLDSFKKSGYQRVMINGEVVSLDDDIVLDKQKKHNISVVVDRLVIKDGIQKRLTDSIEAALKLAEGLVIIDSRIADKTVGERTALPSDNAVGIVEEQNENPAGARSALPRTNGLEQISDKSESSGSALRSPTVDHNSFQGQEQLFSTKYACTECNISIQEIEPRLFSFNSPFGACPTCTGLGYKNEIDPALIYGDGSKSLKQGALSISGWNLDAGSISDMYFEALAARYNFDMTTPYKDLPENIKEILLYGNGGEKLEMTYNSYSFSGSFHKSYEGIVPNLIRRYHSTSSESMKADIEKFMRSSPCGACNGLRLKKEALAVKLNGQNIAQITKLSIKKLADFIASLQLNPTQSLIAAPIIKEINERLKFLMDVGLDYLTLSRSAGSLSGGEAQRIRLATQIGSGLMGVLYILDEPSIGLHQRDNEKLISTLERLRDLGNTLIVVEHDEDTIRRADHIVDIGPLAGVHGGELVAQGTAQDIIKAKNSITGKYLSGKQKIPTPQDRREIKNGYITIAGARQNNLKNITANIPIGVITAITGVSGSGKSSLINQILYPAASNAINKTRLQIGSHYKIDGLDRIDKIINIDQSAIGRTPRSNPATYTGVFTPIRELFSKTTDAKERGYAPGRFSFNVKGGRCEHCTGDGIIKIEMNFLPDVFVPCEVCKGERYNRETLAVRYKGKNISDVLNMTIDEAITFFENIPAIYTKIKSLYDVGLGYIKLGQSATTLSGGEAQRVKLSTELAKRPTSKSLYILDEPTTGLHMADVDRLIIILQRLANSGNTIVVIEHNLDVIKTADYCIDLGYEGGDAGGEIIGIGTPEELADNEKSYTGMFLKKALY